MQLACEELELQLLLEGDEPSPWPESVLPRLGKDELQQLGDELLLPEGELREHAS